MFRFPPGKSLFCAFVGTGSQVFFLSLFVFALALMGRFYPYNRGALFTALIVLYALTACIAGYVAVSTQWWWRERAPAGRVGRDASLN